MKTLILQCHWAGSMKGGQRFFHPAVHEDYTFKRYTHVSGEPPDPCILEVVCDDDIADLICQDRDYVVLASEEHG